MGMREDVSKKGYISTFSKALSPLQNTRIPTNVIQKYVQVREWQVHLQQISDFLSHQLTSLDHSFIISVRAPWKMKRPTSDSAGRNVLNKKLFFQHIISSTLTFQMAKSRRYIPVPHSLVRQSRLMIQPTFQMAKCRWHKLTHPLVQQFLLMLHSIIHLQSQR